MNALSSSTPAAERHCFPAPGSNLYRLITDAEYKRVFHGRIRQGNPWMAFFYRAGILPLFGMSKNVMLLTTRGRKSGRLRQTPIGYFRIDGVLHVFTGWGPNANWYRNIQASPRDVSVQVGMRRFPVHAETVTDPNEVQRALEKLVAQDPQGAKLLMGWDPAADRLETADFSLMLEKVLTVRFLPIQ